jgi:transcriptional regulator with XRE-family HTH domain
VLVNLHLGFYYPHSGSGLRYTNRMKTKESLPDYVARIMKDKGLKPADVEKQSRRLISDSYVQAFISGASANPSIEKLQALARGLGVNEDELFDVARGVDPKMRGRFGDLFLDELFRKCSELEPRRRAEIDGTLRMLDGFVDKSLSEQISQEQEKKRA